jgi:hypothetical protein
LPATVALKIEHGGSQREVEQGLLAIAQRFKSAFDARRALLEDDVDAAHHLFEAPADERQTRLGVGLIVVQR